MLSTMRRFTPILLIFFTLTFTAVDFIGPTTETVEARSRGGGRSFSPSRTYRKPTQRQTSPSTSPTRRGGSSFMRGLAGGLLGGAIGAMLFGSMGGGSGMGIIPILVFAGIGYFLFTRFMKRPASNSAQYQTHSFDGGMDQQTSSFSEQDSVAHGIEMIRQTEPGFSLDNFKEVASDVFFQVQAGWMRRDLDSYRHLLGDHLAKEYEGHFAEMRQKGHINKLESIAVRKVDIVAAGVQDNEEFVTVLFTANLLDYTVDDKSGDLIEGSMTEPVKFAENWTWARPMAGEDNWRLEGIEVVKG